MTGQKKSPFSFSIEALEQELRARSARISPERLFQFRDAEGTPTRHEIMQGVQKKQESPPALNSAFADIETWDLAKILVFKTHPGMDSTRGNASEEVLDLFEISAPHLLYNTRSIAALCHLDDLIPEGNGQLSLRVKNYGKTFNLCDLEPFRDQPVAPGVTGTAFLVAEDVIATASSLLRPDHNLDGLRVVFGYTMTDTYTPNLSFPVQNVFRVVRVVRKPDSDMPGPVLLQLDRVAIGYNPVKRSESPLLQDQDLYVLGHPLGLPLKYVGGATVAEIHGLQFNANIAIYGTHPGSPLFDQSSHEVVGLLVSSRVPDYIWTGQGWMSLNSSAQQTVSCMAIQAIPA